MKKVSNRKKKKKKMKIRGPAIMQPDSDSEDELPPGWEERVHNDGNVFYLK